MQLIREPIRILSRLRFASVVLKLLRLVVIVASVALAWRVLETVRGVRLSLFIVTQEDLRPAFELGDLAVISSSTNFRIGDMVLFQHTPLHEESSLILRRLVSLQPVDGTETRIITKADHNRLDDRYLYKRGSPWETADKIKGKVQFRIAYIGMIPTIRLLKGPQFQRTCAGIFVIFMLLSYKKRLPQGMHVRNLLVLLVLALYTSDVAENFHCFQQRDTKPITVENLALRKVIKDLPNRIKGATQQIQYIIHQTHEQDELPSDMLNAISTVQEQNLEYSYRYYNASQRRKFMEKHMGPTILACYDKIVPNAYKADLFRYSVVYTEGGCYADIGFMFVRPLRDAVRSSDTFVSTADWGNLGINSAFFCAKAGHEILFLTIQDVVGRVATSNYGNDTLDITGPRALRRGFGAYFRNISITIDEEYQEYPGNVRLLKQDFGYGCSTYPILDSAGDGNPLMFHKYPGLAKDTFTLMPRAFHYNDYWWTRIAFNESIVVPADGKYLKVAQ